MSSDTGNDVTKRMIIIVIWASMKIRADDVDWRVCELTLYIHYHIHTVKKLILSVFAILVLAGAAYYFFPEDPLPGSKKIDRIIVRKKARVMEIYSGKEIIKTYSISLGGNPEGDKQYEGDKRTPEGSYRINGKNPHSTYHKNLGISYPHGDDIEEAKRMGVSPGGQIKIHGIRSGLGFIGKFHRVMDWTAGCIAVTDEEIDELYAHVETGTPIIILP